MKEALRALLLAGAAAALAFLAAEGLVRIARPRLAVGPASGNSPFWRHDPELGWFHAPGEKGRFARAEFSHAVSINAMGFRDAERRFDRDDPAALRVAVLGDSFVWGHGVEDAEIFTRLIEERLPGVEVWNLGVSGYSTDQELLLFRRVGDLIRPDLVLLMVCRNDFAANTTRRAGRYPKPLFEDRHAGAGFELTGRPVPPPSTTQWLVNRARSKSAFVNGLAFLAEDAGWIAHGPRGWESQDRVTRFLLDTLLDEIRALGGELMITNAPSAPASGGERRDPTEGVADLLLTGWAAENGVTWADLSSGFIAAGQASATPLHYAVDGHWTVRGHRLAAGILAPLIEAALKRRVREATPAAPHSM